MSIFYPLPPGCIFREDFRNPAMAAANGLTVPDLAWLGGGRGPGVLVTGAGRWITCPKLNTFNPNAMTIISDVLIKTTVADDYRVIFGSTTKMFWGIYNDTMMHYDVSYGRVSSANLGLMNRRMLLAYVVQPNTVSFYLNGSFVSTHNISYKKTIAAVVGITHYINSATYRLRDPIFGLRLYNYAMTADEIASDYYTVRGIQ
jgi:hypothetical protein